MPQSAQYHRAIAGWPSCSAQAQELVLREQVREKRAATEERKKREREADEREERRARAGHAQLVAQAQASSVPNKGPFDSDPWQGLSTEVSQEVLLGPAGESAKLFKDCCVSSCEAAADCLLGPP